MSPAKPPGEFFMPLPQVRVVMDLQLGRPVLLLGYWVNGQHQAMAAEVLTMSQPRSLVKIHEIAPPPPRPPVSDD